MTQAEGGTALRISLADVARLTKVQRPVVSMWRTRSANSDLPFPAPIAKEQGQEYFAVDDIVAWIEATGRGKNRTVREDAAAFASLDSGSPRGDEIVFLGLTALLCLSATSGQSFARLSPQELLNLADEADPDDHFLYDELAALGGRLLPLSRYAEMLADAAYSPLAAFEQLMGERFRLHVPGHTEVGLTPIGRQLVTEIAIALAGAADNGVPTYVDPTVGGSDLLIELADRVDESVSLAAQTSRSDESAARLARRRLLIHDIHQAPLVEDEFGGFELPPGALMLAQYPSPGRPDMTDAEILDAIDSSVLEMMDDGYGVVIAPASALTDRTPATEQRAAILRTNRVRGIVRLPAGLITTRPRQRMALWVLGPVATRLRLVDADPVEPWTIVADLTDVALDSNVIDGLATDLVAGLRAPSRRGHEPHFTRFVLNRVLVSSRGSLVAAEPPRAGRTETTGSDIAVRAAQVGETLRASMTLQALPLLSVREQSLDRFGSSSTLGAAISSKQIQILPGHRIEAAHIRPATAGATAVIGIEEVTGAAAIGGRAIDRLVFAANYPAGRYTEPGDVVFCTTPQPAAVVDVDGGSVVAFPARIGRVTPAGSLSPHVLAADINASAPQAKSFRAWTIRHIPNDQRTELDRMLGVLGSHRAALTERIGAVDDLASLLIQGTSSGNLMITTPMKGS